MQPSPKPSGTPAVSGLERKRRVGGRGWLLIGVGLFVAAGLMSILRTQRPPAPARVQPIIASYFGIDEFKSANDGGVTFNYVYPPGSATDRAGLVGGDVITIFDGHEIKQKDDLIELLGVTPVGKTVEVTYVRDHQTRKTKLTTISGDQYEKLVVDFENRPEGQGAFGFEFPESAYIESTRIFGVRSNALTANGPAAKAGMQPDDIVFEFDGIPIRTRSEFIERVRRAIPDSIVKVLVMRGEQQLEIPVKIGKRGRANP